MPIVDGSGQATGTSVVDGVPTLVIGGVGISTGLSTVSGVGGILSINGGVAIGVGTLSWVQFIEGAGISTGSSTVTGSADRILSGKGKIVGIGTLSWSYPLPMVGRSTLTGEPTVERPYPPINATTTIPRTLRFLEFLKRGDLPIYLRDSNGPCSPVRVVYTLFFIRPDNSKLQVGPTNQIPVSGDVGEYYVVGRIGEGGQPGRWQVKWEFQRTYQSTPQIREMCFRVQDAAALASPQDSLIRVRKYGWN